MLSLFTYIILALCLALLLLAEIISGTSKSRNLADIISGKGQWNTLNSKQLFGIFVFAAGSAWAAVFADIDHTIFEFDFQNCFSLISLPLIAIALIIGYSNAGRQKGKTQELNGYLLTIYLVLRIIFLILYEYFFRGILLFFVWQEINLFTSIIINIILYALLHWYSKREEFIGTVPFGFLLCLVTVAHHSVWPAVIIHLALAMSNELRLINQQASSTKSINL